MLACLFFLYILLSLCQLYFSVMVCFIYIRVVLHGSSWHITVCMQWSVNCTYSIYIENSSQHKQAIILQEQHKKNPLQHFIPKWWLARLAMWWLNSLKKSLFYLTVTVFSWKLVLNADSQRAPIKLNNQKRAPWAFIHSPWNYALFCWCDLLY